MSNNTLFTWHSSKLILIVSFNHRAFKNDSSASSKLCTQLCIYAFHKSTFSRGLWVASGRGRLQEMKIPPLWPPCVSFCVPGLYIECRLAFNEYHQPSLIEEKSLSDVFVSFLNQECYCPNLRSTQSLIHLLYFHVRKAQK